jgi:hypothetical protein
MILEKMRKTKNLSRFHEEESVEAGMFEKAESVVASC